MLRVGFRSVAFLILSACTALAGGCAGMQSALNPAGSQAGSIFGQFQLVFWIAAAVYCLTILAMLIAALRRRRKENADLPVTEPPTSQDRRISTIVGTAIGVTVVILFVFLLADFFTGRAMANISRNPNPLTIKVTGHQWWWEVQYVSETPSQMITTANEIHIPVGRPVKLQLTSVDVNHSFWVPNLSGKKDLIPGHPTETWIEADRPGHYRGQCAEYCGAQHAHMRFLVVAEGPEVFEAWYAAQLQSAPEPTTASARRGLAVFRSETCPMCHTVQGTGAFSRFGPDLTHLASREFIAAGTLPNNRGNLGGWVIDPQSIKPGTRMPQNSLTPDELNALLDYLQTLQ